MDWLRYYTATLDNPKIQDLPSVLFKAWVNLLCLARRNEGAIPHLEVAAFSLRRHPKVVRSWLAELETRGLMDRDSGGNLVPHDWNAHQYVSDHSTSRVQKHRMKRDETVSETFPKRLARATEQTTEAETDSERVSLLENLGEKTHTQRARVPVVADLIEQPSTRFAEWIQPWPRKVGIDDAARAWISVVTKKNEAAVFAARDRYLASEEVSRNVVMGPAKWIFQQARDGFNGTWPLKQFAAPANGHAGPPKGLII
jgi:hypothetical protein